MTIRLFVVHFVNEAGDQSRTCTLAVNGERSAPALCRRAEAQLNVTQEGGPWKAGAIAGRSQQACHYGEETESILIWRLQWASGVYRRR